MNRSMMSFQNISHHRRPERWLEATGECFVLCIGVSWLVTSVFNPGGLDKCTVARSCRHASGMRVAYQKPVQCRKGVRFHVVLYFRSCTPPFRSVTCFVGWLGNTLSHAYIRHVLIAFCLGYVARPAGIFRDNILRSIVGYNNLCAPWRAATVRQQFDFTRSLMPSSEKLLLCVFFFMGILWEMCHA